MIILRRFFFGILANDIAIWIFGRTHVEPRHSGTARSRKQWAFAARKRAGRFEASVWRSAEETGDHGVWNAGAALGEYQATDLRPAAKCAEPGEFRQWVWYDDGHSDRQAEAGERESEAEVESGEGERGGVQTEGEGLLWE